MDQGDLSGARDDGGVYRHDRVVHSIQLIGRIADRIPWLDLSMFRMIWLDLHMIFGLIKIDRWL